LALALSTLGVVPCSVNAGSPPDGVPPSNGGRPAKTDGQPSEKATTTTAVLVNDPRAFQGYTLSFPLRSTKTYLLDMQGRVVRTWESKYTAGQDAYLLANGHLLRAAKLSENEAFFGGAGAGGRIQEFTWEGQLIWDFKFHNQKQIQHHAITPMPNGNVLLVVWERKAAKEAIEAGVKPEMAGTGDMLVDSLVEIQPMGKTGGKVVWEWHLWDHLVQDHDKTKANYGDLAAHPELVDANFARNPSGAFDNLARFVNPGPKKADATQGDSKKDPLNKLKGIGYVGAGGGKQFAGFIPDWTHANAVAYNAKLDQVMFTCREFSEVWIIDHSTTKAEAAGHRGGRRGKGGDLLYRWGNPRAYRAGLAADQRLFVPHDAHWIPEGVPGEGHLLVFSNGGGRTDGLYSSVDEVVLPVDGQGCYAYKPGTAFGPDQPVWSYTAPTKTDFFAPLMAGAQRLPNGNTLICTGLSGTIFEVTPAKEIVWKYIAPADSRPRPGGLGVRPPGGGPDESGGPRPSVQLVPPFAQGMLQFTPNQAKQLEELQKGISAKLEKMLTDDQKAQIKEMRAGSGSGRRRGGLGGSPQLGRVMPEFLQDRLKLTAEQKKQLGELQKEADGTLDRILTGEQREQLKGFEEMLKAFAAGGPAGFGLSGNPLFRAYRYAPNYPGLVGKDLAPVEPLDNGSPKEPPPK
jgi:hypothetical protein